jgi:hypothetical protein
MQPQHVNNRNNTPLEIAMQQLVEAHTRITQMMTQNLANRDGRDLPMGVQQVLDNHSRMVQIMSQMMPSTNNSLSQSDLDGRSAKVDVEVMQRVLTVMWMCSRRPCAW